jgi:dipeptidase
LYLDNQHTSTYVPIYCGVTDVSPLYKAYDPDRFDENSARWAIDFVDNLLYLRWQDAIQDLRNLRDPLEAAFFAELEQADKKAAALYRRSPRKARAYLTGHTVSCMERVVDMYRALRNLLISKYTNNKLGV